MSCLKYFKDLYASQLRPTIKLQDQVLRQSLKREKKDNDDKQKVLSGSLHILFNALMDNPSLNYISEEQALIK
jgi:hypothetical protein